MARKLIGLVLVMSLTLAGCDTILNWHPGSSNAIGAGSCNALMSVTFEFYGATAHGAAGHTWGIGLGSNYSTGYKGMRKATQNIAATALDLLTKPELLRKVQKQFEERTGEVKYYSLPEPESKPSLDLFTALLTESLLSWNV